MVSAVHPLPEDSNLQEVWQELKPHLDDYKISDYDKEKGNYHMAEGGWNGLSVETRYHSEERKTEGGEEVIEVVIQKEWGKDVGVKGLENILEEINNDFPMDFTLEVYHWYTGVDRPGAKPLKKEKEFGAT